MTDQESNKLENLLKDTMQQELILTRALLGNLHQEEQSLIVQDNASWNQVMQERAPMLEKLKTLRLERLNVTSQIAGVLHVSFPNFLEENFPLNLDSCCEILHLSDQLIALTERLNLQQNRNHYLMVRTPKLPQLQPISTSAKTKVTVATYPDDTLR